MIRVEGYRFLITHLSLAAEWSGRFLLPIGH